MVMETLKPDFKLHKTLDILPQKDLVLMMMHYDWIIVSSECAV